MHDMSICQRPLLSVRTVFVVSSLVYVIVSLCQCIACYNRKRLLDNIRGKRILLYVI